MTATGVKKALALVLLGLGLAVAARDWIGGQLFSGLASFFGGAVGARWILQGVRGYFDFVMAAGFALSMLCILFDNPPPGRESSDVYTQAFTLLTRVDAARCPQRGSEFTKDVNEAMASCLLEPQKAANRILSDLAKAEALDPVSGLINAAISPKEDRVDACAEAFQVVYKQCPSQLSSLSEDAKKALLKNTQSRPSGSAVP